MKNLEEVEQEKKDDKTKRKPWWDLYPEQANNNRKRRGYPMMRNAGKRKRMTKQQYKDRNIMPFM